MHEDPWTANPACVFHPRDLTEHNLRTMTRDFLYFAYGSNMFTHRLRARVPSAKAVGTGYIRKHRLCWHKRGWKDGSGKCDISFTGDRDHRVYGVLFTMSFSGKAKLDRAEGLGNGYDEKTVEVITPSGAVLAGTYYATAVDPQLHPYTWYKRYVIEGAREHGLPETWVRTLDAVETIDDPDPERAQRETRLLDND